MEDAREDFPPVPLPEPFFPPPNAAPARLVRVPFKPALSKACGNLVEISLNYDRNVTVGFDIVVSNG